MHTLLNGDCVKVHVDICSNPALNLLSSLITRTTNLYNEPEFFFFFKRTPGHKEVTMRAQRGHFNPLQVPFPTRSNKNTQAVPLEIMCYTNQARCWAFCHVCIRVHLQLCITSDHLHIMTSLSTPTNQLALPHSNTPHPISHDNFCFI